MAWRGRASTVNKKAIARYPRMASGEKSCRFLAGLAATQQGRNAADCGRATQTENREESRHFRNRNVDVRNTNVGAAQTRRGSLRTPYAILGLVGRRSDAEVPEIGRTCDRIGAGIGPGQVGNLGVVGVAERSVVQLGEVCLVGVVRVGVVVDQVAGVRLALLVAERLPAATGGPGAGGDRWLLEPPGPGHIPAGRLAAYRRRGARRRRLSVREQ